MTEREQIEQLQREIEQLRATPAIPEAAIRAVWAHGADIGYVLGPHTDDLYAEYADEIGRLFAEALKR